MSDLTLAIWNGCEALVWLAMAMAISRGHRSSPADTRRIARGTIMFLVLFAVSDVIEMNTGAWWRPTGLLVLKGICLAALIPLFAILLWRSRQA